MQLPVDIKAVFDEVTNIEEAKKTPLSVNIYMDESSQGDIQALIRQFFASRSPYTRVSTIYFPSFPVVASEQADVAVIVAGTDEHIGRYAADIRASGVPVVVVTSSPEFVFDCAAESGYPLDRKDIISPVDRRQKKALPEDGELVTEPVVLTASHEEIVKKTLSAWILAVCADKSLAFAIAFTFIRRTLALEAVGKTSLQNAGVGLVAIIPGADMPIMTLNQAKMLLQIAAAYGQSMDIDRIKEIAVVVGGGFLFRSIARQVVAFVPGIGWLVKAAVGYGGTQAMGHAAIEYFEGGGSFSGLAEVVDRARVQAVRAADSNAGKKVISSVKGFVVKALKM